MKIISGKSPKIVISLICLALLILLMGVTVSHFSPTHAASPQATTHAASPQVVRKVNMACKNPNKNGKCKTTRYIFVNGIQEGDCGTSEIEITQGAISGTADIYWALDSFLGPMTFITGTVNVNNKTQGQSNNFPITQFVDPPSSFVDDTFTADSGTGDVVATLSGTVTLQDGTQCQILNPSAETTIN